MVAETRRIARSQGWLHGDEVHPDGQRREPRTVGQLARADQAGDRAPEMVTLAPAEGVFRQAKRPGAPPAHLDHHEPRRRSRVKRDQVELTAADADMTSQDEPTRGDETIRDRLLGFVPGELLGRTEPGHRPRMTGTHRRVVYPRSSGTQKGAADRRRPRSILLALADTRASWAIW